MSADPPAALPGSAEPPRPGHRVDVTPDHVDAVPHPSPLVVGQHVAGERDALRELVGTRTRRLPVPLAPAAQDEQLRRTESGLARLWGADQAYVLPNGSTSGNQAILLAGTSPGERVLVARDAQVSTHAALILTGVSPVWVSPRVDGQLNVATGIHPADVTAALVANPDVRTMHLTSPSYAGVCSDLPALRAATAGHGVTLVVDETWAPHLRWHPALGIDAMSAGADAVISSTPAPSSSPALLFVQEKAFDLARVANAVRMTQPVAPYVAPTDAVEACRRRLEDDAEGVVGKALEIARLARSLLARIPGVHVVSAADLALPVDRVDPCRIVLEIRGRGLDGPGAARILREDHGIRVEGADASRVHLVVGFGYDVGSVRRLVLAVAAVGSWSGPARQRRPDPLAVLPRPGEQALLPREAWFADSRPVPLHRAVGRVCAELITPHPPGVPVATPGEVLTAHTVAWLLEASACGVHLHGSEDPTLGTVRVVAGC